MRWWPKLLKFRVQGLALIIFKQIATLHSSLNRFLRMHFEVHVQQCFHVYFWHGIRLLFLSRCMILILHERMWQDDAWYLERTFSEMLWFWKVGYQNGSLNHFDSKDCNAHLAVCPTLLNKPITQFELQITHFKVWTQINFINCDTSSCFIPHVSACMLHIEMQIGVKLC